MKSAYLYVRVSTDEQKRKGYSLPEQEDRLLKHCRYHDIEVKGIFREDFSAKNFNRPEWKRLVATIKKKPSGEGKNILFLKWDRFSRNIEYAYEMIGILRRYHTTAMAIDQPIDFSVPESTVMLAVYLSIPEAENARKSLNVASTIRRAKQMGRYPNRAPLGFINLATLDGRKYIAPRQPDADILAWAFGQLARNAYTIEEVRRMAIAKGLKCSRSNFWQLLRNPVYCGFVSLPSETEGRQLIKGLHEPLIPEALFYEVQNIIGTKRKVVGRTDELKSTFVLKGYLDCPVCGQKLRGSFSKGRTKRYPYYHCSAVCGIRFKAELLNGSYNEKLQQLTLSNGAEELFALVLEDANAGIQKARYLNERQQLQKKLGEEEAIISQARKLFVADRLKFDDFSELKREYRDVSGTLKKELDTVTMQLARIDRQFGIAKRSLTDIFYEFLDLNPADQKQIISVIPPASINIGTGNISLQLNDVISKILSPKSQFDIFKHATQHSRQMGTIISDTANFTDRKITVRRAVAILAKNRIQVDDSEAYIILDFLYHIANTFKWSDGNRKR